MLCCCNCGSIKVQVRAWIDANTNAFISDIEDGVAWCDDCEDYCKLEEKDETN